ncbi:MAG: gliding motility-associated C-terminal domain-containing protein [Flavobacteriales bacterium]|nr:gliding motility-associated C-terminal domain-containing protein [Flavobacteriales bacterium]MCB9194383.1 gliding motility-associated C-terminal domain-containing protein [Flavobacteriales bacterium]
MRSTTSGILSLSLAISFAVPTHAQNGFTIHDGQDDTCIGALFDSGGQGGGGYSNNEDFTYTICPDVPGDVIYLTWITFNLDQTGPNPHDNLTIYDGNTTGAPTLGTYTGNALQGLVVSGTTFNTSGCLTLVWHSNGSGTGIFAASISCDTPCDHPTAAAIMSEPAPAKICVGETLSFDGSTSTAAPGFSLSQYLWDFDDGSVDSTSGPLVDHTFATPGEHVVQLYLTDDNECNSTNLVDLQVLVGTPPDFTGTSPDQTTCLGETACLNGVVNGTTWTGLPDANYGNGVYLPDDVGQSFTSTLTFTQFGFGQTVTDTSDIVSICVDMEHSFMGDLVIQVICPNGQTMIMHQQGGGGTFIGDANDADSNLNPVPGTCWTYCWSPTATNGTWADNAQFGPTPNVVPSSQGTALAPGTYQSVQPFNNLVGCPLNGDWTFQVTDLWALDNGFLCSWQMNFDPAIFPPLTTFTPVYGIDCDSTYWTGPNIGSISTDCDSMCVTPSAPGSYDYVYHVVDDFGCSYDTTVQVTIDPPMTVDAGLDQVVCNDPIQLQAVAQGSSGTVSFSWSPPTGLTNATISNPIATVTSPTTYTVSAYPTGHPACAVEDSMNVTLDPGLDPGLDTLVIICATTPPFAMIDMLGGTPNPGGVWTDANGNTIPGNFDPMNDAPGTFTYTLTTTLGCVGTADLEIQVLPITDPTCCGIVDAGPDTLVCSLSCPLSATVATPGLGSWSGPAGTVFSDPTDPQATFTGPATGTYTLFWHENDGNYCDLIDSVHVTVTQPIAISFQTTDAVCYQACDGTVEAQVTGGVTQYNYTYLWSGGVAGPAEDQAVDLCAGGYMLTVLDDNGCTDSASYTIGEPALLIIDSARTSPTTCHGYCDGSISIFDAEAVAYSYDGGASYVTTATQDSICAGVHDIAIKNSDGCIGTDQVVVGQPPPVVADFTWSPIPANVNDPTIHFHNTSTDAISYFWTVDELGSLYETEFSWTFPDKFPGTYAVCLVAYNLNFCSDTTCHDVTIDDVLFDYFPNAFTPDGDGVNDVFRMVYNIDDIKDYSLLIFDRWGELIYESNDPTDGWDGTFRNGGGNIVAEGIYPWRAQFKLKTTSGLRDMVGHVTLLK